MSHIILQGGARLEGTLPVQGAKNSVLPILAASILHPGRTVLQGCPHLSDVEASIRILRHLGCRADWEGGDLVVDASGIDRWDIPGPRPIDLHLAVLRQLGAGIREEGGCLRCTAQRLEGREITLSMPSVGATENAILAACGAHGETVLLNAAREPEIGDLQDFLCAMGCQVKGAGSSTICIQGRSPTRDVRHTVMPDRIVAATYLAAAAAAGGEVELTQVHPGHLSTVTAALHAAGCQIYSGEGRIVLRSEGRLRSIGTVRTAPYPGFPTDAQAILMAALLRGQGSTVFVENIFENRYRHVDELCRMGADIRVADRVAVVTGVPCLCGASVRCTDLRGGAALLVAGAAAQGETRIGDIFPIQRGYQDPVGDLRQLGARIETG